MPLPSGKMSQPSHTAQEAFALLVRSATGWTSALPLLTPLQLHSAVSRKCLGGACSLAQLLVGYLWSPAQNTPCCSLCLPSHLSSVPMTAATVQDSSTHIFMMNK